MKMIFTILLAFTVTEATASETNNMTNAYLNGTWDCSSQTVYPGDMVVELNGRVGHQVDAGHYAYTGRMVSYFKHDPDTVSVLSIVKSGSYTLEANHLSNFTEEVKLTPGKDGLGIHSDDFMMMMSNGLRQPAIAELTVINANEFESVVIDSGGTERCIRSTDDKLSD